MRRTIVTSITLLACLPVMGRAIVFAETGGAATAHVPYYGAGAWSGTEDVTGIPFAGPPGPLACLPDVTHSGEGTLAGLFGHTDGDPSVGSATLSWVYTPACESVAGTQADASISATLSGTFDCGELSGWIRRDGPAIAGQLFGECTYGHFTDAAVLFLEATWAPAGVAVTDGSITAGIVHGTYQFVPSPVT